MEKATRRGNYDSGSDYVLEYGELRFSFNEEDFAQRVEQAAVKLDFVDQGLGGEELHDLLELAVNGEIREPTSSLGEHINEHWTELVGPANRSLVHWIRRLVFRGAWLDQRVKEGELDVVFDADTQSFGYVQPERDAEPIELSREPSWARLAYRRVGLEAREQLGVRGRPLDPLAQKVAASTGSRSASSERSRRIASSSSGSRSSSSFEIRHSATRSAGIDPGGRELAGRA